MSTLASTIGRGVTASRPAAGNAGRLYYCTDSTIGWYRDNGSSWDACEPASLSNPMTTAGDVIYGGASGAPTRLASGTNTKQFLRAASGASPTWAIPPNTVRTRIIATVDNASVTHNVNTTSYLAPAVTQFYHDWDLFPATHFHISGFGGSTTAAQTITWQLTPQSDPTNPVSASGDDLVFTNTAGVFSSGWIAVSDSMSGLTLMALSRKGSDGTVDWSGRWLDIAFKIA